MLCNYFQNGYAMQLIVVKYEISTESFHGMCKIYTRLKREEETYRSCNQEKKGQKEAMRLHDDESKNE